MKTLIVYDARGYVVSNITGDYHVPNGIPFLEVEIPEGKRIKITNGIGVDVSSDPHQVILEDIPPTEVDKLNARLSLLQKAFDEYTLGV
ncbi:hypothetical protein [Paenibacillus sp. SN-8-1]|uniref:hypothetical protein n=1 Tax=Paenibacillus sp. SN-8-1 TaxID=3435409 RepID=UPI003D9A3D73